MLPLVVQALEINYPGLSRPALSIAELALPAGAHVAITGPSGSGKTTLINLLAGLDRAPQGRISWRDIDIARLSEPQRDRWRARNVGLIMQEFHLFPGLSAVDNVLLPYRLSHLATPGQISQRATQLLAQVGIETIGQPVETMSRGQMQRVAVARALVANPGIIVADEPTASLDENSGLAVADLLLELARQTGATLIAATHDAALTRRMETHLRLENGKLV